MENNKNIIFAGLIVAAVILVYYFSKQRPTVVSQAQNPNPGTGSGLAPLPANSSSISIPPLQIPLSPPITLPANNIGGNDYLFYNAAPVQTKPNPDIEDGGHGGGCGCQTCNVSNMRQPDGAGGSLAYTPAQMLANTDPAVWNDALQNLVGSGQLNSQVAAQYMSNLIDAENGGVPAGSIQGGNPVNSIQQ